MLGDGINHTLRLMNEFDDLVGSQRFNPAGLW
jgi:hypothetical protein